MVYDLYIYLTSQNLDMNFNLTGVKQHAHRFCKENWRF